VTHDLADKMHDGALVFVGSSISLTGTHGINPQVSYVKPSDNSNSIPEGLRQLDPSNDVEGLVKDFLSSL
jgi:hypothetical protein